MMRTQIDPRRQGAAPHNRLSDYGRMGSGARSEDDVFRYEQPASPPTQQSAPQQSSSGFDASSFLNTLGSMGQLPTYQGANISGLSAGGGISIGKDGAISIENPNQSQLGAAALQANSGNYQAGLGALANMFGSMASAGSQLGTAQIQGDTSRDVAGINSASNEKIALTQAQSASEVAGIQTQSAERIQQMVLNGQLSEIEAQKQIAEINAASQQRIAEIQNAPAQLEHERFYASMDMLNPFLQAMAEAFGGGGGGDLGGGAYQVDPQALINNAQAQNAMGAAAANRAGGGGGSAANSAAARDIAQQEASANARAAFDIPLQVNQQNFQNRQTARQNDLQQLQTLAQFIPNLFGSLG